MAYKYKERMLEKGSPWTDDDGVKHPYNWASSWSSDDLTKWGVSVVTVEDNNFDSKFYLAKGVEKSLDDILVTHNGEKVIDPVTGKQAVSLGLKNQFIANTKETAKELLAKTDWQITRKAEKGTAIDSSIATYRDDVRTACNSIETKIKACSNLTEYMALFQAPDKEKVSPINEWPDEVS